MQELTPGISGKTDLSKFSSSGYEEADGGSSWGEEAAGMLRDRLSFPWCGAPLQMRAWQAH